tara:strand:- start:208 stop:342 length:135 start_codon:yes stop_codon:yes gene_type:complete
MQALLGAPQQHLNSRSIIKSVLAMPSVTYDRGKFRTHNLSRMVT